MSKVDQMFQRADPQLKREHEDRRWQRRFWRRFAAFLLAASATMAWIVIEYSPSQSSSWSN